MSFSSKLPDFIGRAEDAAAFLGTAIPQDAVAVEKIYPVLTNTYYLGLVERDNPFANPIWKQCMPDKQEIEDNNTSEDGLAELKQMPVPRLIHRYVDRAVLLVTAKCAVHCRFCFRKRNWKNGACFPDISDGELQEVCAYLKTSPKIREVLVSGGDPLMLSEEKLLYILKEISAIESIDAIRIATRIPVVMPMRIGNMMVKQLAALKKIWVVTHFNHPREVTAQSERACRKLVKAGIPVLSQTVLLAGINDDADTLQKLFQELVRIKVKPLYLFHVDPIRGACHFATGIEKGKQILRALRPRLSSLAMPSFAIDLPDGGGKVTLQPDYCIGDGYEAIDGRTIPYYQKN